MSNTPTNSSSSTSSPNPQFAAAYQDLLGRATGVANTPYSAYQGQTVAPLSSDQQNANSIAESTPSTVAPYLSQANQFISNSQGNLLNGVQQLTPQQLQGEAASGLGDIGQAGSNNGIQAAAGQFNPNSVAAWQSPYTQQVVNATEGQLQQQDQQQQSSLAGNAVSQGAWGGDRSAAAQAMLGGQQALANNSTISNLYNQGYTQALGASLNSAQLGTQAATANTQAQLGAGSALLGNYQNQQQLGLAANQGQDALASQAGFAEAGLGNEALGSQLQSYQALMNSGNLEQQQQQAQLNVPYSQYQASQAYPFQTTGWLGNLVEGIGGAAGGTSTTTSPGASPISQAAGLGLTGAAIYGLLNRGGSVSRAPGGNVPPFGMTIPDESKSIIPGASGLSVASSGKPSAGFQSMMGQTTTSRADGGGMGVGQAMQLGQIGLGELSGQQQFGANNNGLLSAAMPQHAQRYHAPGSATSPVMSAPTPDDVGSGMTTAWQGASLPGVVPGQQVSDFDRGIIQNNGGLGFPQPSSYNARGGTVRRDDGGSLGGLSMGQLDQQMPQSSYSPSPSDRAAQDTVGVAMRAHAQRYTAPRGIEPLRPGSSEDDYPQQRDVGGGIDDDSSDFLNQLQLSQLGLGDAPSLSTPLGMRGNVSDQLNGLSLASTQGIPGGTPQPTMPTAPSAPPVQMQDLPPPGASDPTAGAGLTGQAPTGQPGGLAAAGAPPPPAQVSADANQPTAVNQPSASASNVDDGGYKANKYMALLQAGLGIMAGTSPNAIANIGRGAMAGVQEYGDEKKLQAQDQNRRALLAVNQEEAATRKDQGDQNIKLRAQQLAQQATQAQASLASTDARAAATTGIAQQNTDLTAKKVDLESQGTWQPSMGMVTDPNNPEGPKIPGTILTNSRTGEIRADTSNVIQKGAAGVQGKSFMDDGTIKTAAQQLAAGDTTALQHATAADAAKIRKAASDIVTARGGTGADLAAASVDNQGNRSEARAQGNRAGAIGMAVQEAANFAPQALAASAKVPRTQYPTLNAIELAVKKGTGDENVIALQGYTQSLSNAYARAITPSGQPTEGAQNRAKEFLDKAWSQGQFETGVRTMANEMVQAQKSPSQARQQLLSSITGKPFPAISVEDIMHPAGASPGASQPSAAPAAGSPPAVAAPAQAAREAPLPMPSTKDQMQTGKVYQTGKGLLRWNGASFDPVQ